MSEEIKIIDIDNGDSLVSDEAITEESKEIKNDSPVLSETGELSAKKNSDGDNNEGSRKVVLLPLLFYFLVYAGTVLLGEAVLKFQATGGVSERHLPLLLFVPAEAMFFAAISGFARKHRVINKILMILFMIVIGLYYCIQFVYYKIFGSLVSVSMLGMGQDAVGNFGWAMKDTIIGAIWIIALCLVPAIAAAIVLFVNKKSGKGYSWWAHIIALGLTIGLWFAGILGLKLMGEDRQSAYYVFNDSLADTDTTAERLGALTTSIVEGGSYFFGIKTGNGTQLSAVDNNALLLPTKPEDSITDNSDTDTPTDKEDNTGKDKDETPSDEIEPEEIEEEIPVFEIKPQVNEAINFEELVELTNNSEVKALCEYFGSKTPTNTNQYTGMFEGYNLVYICAESFSNYAIDPNVTPLLYQMVNNGIVLNNYYDSFKNTTTNGEFAFTASFWPDVSRDAMSGTAVGSFPQSANNFMPYGLGDLFSGEGVPTYAYHNYYGDYYKRKYSWPNLGYENIKFMDDGMKFSTTWPASDVEMMEQSIDDYIDQDRFFAYYMTFSGHGNYSKQSAMSRKHWKTVTALLGDKYQSEEVIAYLCGEYELDQALRYLVNRLSAAGKLENTVFVLAGDHDPYALTDTGKNIFAGHEVEQDFELYRDPVIIYNSAMKEPIISGVYCCNVDIVPTVLNLFGIEYDSRLLMGIDVFSDGIHRARIYNGSFVTDICQYNKRTGEIIWQEAAQGYDEDTLNAYFEAMLDYTTNEYSASLKSLSNNFMFYVWCNSGLLTDEEIQAEKDREATGKAIYQREAEEEAARKAEEERIKELEEQGLDPDGNPIPGWTPPEPAPEG